MCARRSPWQTMHPINLYWGPSALHDGLFASLPLHWFNPFECIFISLQCHAGKEPAGLLLCCRARPIYQGLRVMRSGWISPAHPFMCGESTSLMMPCERCRSPDLPWWNSWGIVSFNFHWWWSTSHSYNHNYVMLRSKLRLTLLQRRL